MMMGLLNVTLKLSKKEIESWNVLISSAEEAYAPLKDLVLAKSSKTLKNASALRARLGVRTENVFKIDKRAHDSKGI